MMQQPQPGKAASPQGKAASPQTAQLAPLLAQLTQGKAGAPKPGGAPQGPAAGTPTAQGHMGATMGPMSNPNAGGFAGYQSPPSSAQPPKAF